MGRDLGLPRIFCKHCGYCLHGLPENRCPECGRPFDPADVRTFRRRPLRIWPRRVRFWGGLSLLLLCVGYGGGLGWLYMGWKGEEAARALAMQPMQIVLVIRPILRPERQWLLPRPCRPWLDRIREVDITGPVPAGTVEAIARCRWLQSLSVYFIPLSAAHIDALSRISTLKTLTLFCTDIRGADAASLPRLRNLEALSLIRETGIDDVALARLTGMTGLKRLALVWLPITDDGLAHLAQLPHLEELTLARCDHLGKGAPAALANLAGLRRLVVHPTMLGADGEQHVLRQLPNCKIQWQPGSW